MIVPAYYEELHTHHIGTEPNRAYYIPAAAVSLPHSLSFWLLRGFLRRRATGCKQKDPAHTVPSNAVPEPNPPGYSPIVWPEKHITVPTVCSRPAHPPAFPIPPDSAPPQSPDMLRFAPAPRL